MATYRTAIQWIAENDGAGDTPLNMTYQQAYDEVSELVTVCLVSDIFHKSVEQVTCNILKARGFKN